MEIALSIEQQAQLSQIAALEGKDADEVAREVFLRALRARASLITSQADRTKAQEAVARMLEFRQGNVLPEGVTIQDMIREGRD
jgi:hypothetical protein